MANFPTIGSQNDRQNPFRALARVQRQMDRLFDEFFSEGRTFRADLPSLLQETVYQPPCDIEETDSHYLMSFDLPGMSKDHIQVELADNQLRVYGERRDDQEQRRGSRSRSERYYGAIERTVSLPANIKLEEVETQFENGVLRIAIPKAESAKPRQIQIGEGKSKFFSKLIGKKEEKPAGKEQAA